MKKHKQLIRHNPDKDEYGDCHRTALACLLDLDDPRAAPHFIGTFEQLKKRGTNFAWHEAQERWLNDLGYTTVDIVFGDGGEDKSRELLDGVFKFMGNRNPRAYYLLGGTSPRGTNHIVVCCGNGFEWDPHPDGGFLVGPMDHGFYEVTFILPLSMKAKTP